MSETHLKPIPRGGIPRRIPRPRIFGGPLKPPLPPGPIEFIGPPLGIPRPLKSENRLKLAKKITKNVMKIAIYSDLIGILTVHVHRILWAVLKQW